MPLPSEPVFTRTLYQIAERFIGVKEVPGTDDNPQVMAMLNLDVSWPQHDEVPWCSAFLNYCAWILRLPRSKNLLARSWLAIGTAILPKDAEKGFDVVILNRDGIQDPTDTTGPGHVALFSGWAQKDRIALLGGNQGNSVRVSIYNAKDILGVRRLWP